MRLVGTTATFTIGELARRTGLPVKTIRFYSDEGLLPPTDRTDAGYRLYDATAMARLELVRTLRELGLGLVDVSAALTRSATVGELATRHVEALDEQIRRLRLRRAVLRAVAKRDSELEEVKLMNRLASMSDEERKRLVDEFWDEMVAGLEIDEEFYRRDARREAGAARRPVARAARGLDRVRRAGPGPGVPGPDPRHERNPGAADPGRRVRAAGGGLAAELAGLGLPRGSGGRQPGESPTSEAGQTLAAEIAAATARPGPGPGVGGVPRGDGGPVRDERRPAGRALLAAAGDHQRLAAGPDGPARGAVHDRGTARLTAEERSSATGRG